MYLDENNILEIESISILRWKSQGTSTQLGLLESANPSSWIHDWQWLYLMDPSE